MPNDIMFLLDDPEIADYITTFFAVFSVVAVITAAVAVILWLFGAIGIFKMSKRLNISAPWLSFIMPVYPFAFGRVAEKYVKRNGTGSAKLSVWLIVLYIAKFVFLGAFFAALIAAIGSFGTNAYSLIESETAVASSSFSVFIPAIIFYFISFAVSVTYAVLYYLSFWRICAVFDNKNATLYLVLAILFANILLPIFLFAIRNKEPLMKN